MKRLENKTAIITGATSGIGEEQAYAFAREGANVVVVGRNEKRIKDVVDKIKEAGGNAVGHMAHVENSNECSAAAAAAIKAFGSIDILANTAGIFDDLSKSLEITEEKWKYIFDVNVNSVFYMCNAVLPEMLKNEHGVILNMASISGITSGPGGSAYVASKHAVVGYTKQLSLEYAGQGIRINGIAPGSVVTPLLEDILAADPAGVQRRLDMTPAGRLGKPDDIAKLSVFLASDDADWIHGAIISIDGGRFLKG